MGEAIDWRAGMWAVALLCGVSALLFLALTPKSRGFVPQRARGATGHGILPRLLALLRSPQQWALYAQGFLLMGAFVAVYNYLGFHLVDRPFSLPVWVVTLLFLAYLSGTVSSPCAGALATRHGRYPVLLASIAVMAGGATLMIAPLTVVVLAGLVLFTAGFFGAHAVASGWVPVSAPPASRAQASSLYYFGYYAGSSVFGWLLGLVLTSAGWTWFVVVTLLLCVASASAAAAALHSAPNGRA